MNIDLPFNSHVAFSVQDSFACGQNILRRADVTFDATSPQPVPKNVPERRVQRLTTSVARTEDMAWR
jgi:hypothetical protein